MPRTTFSITAIANDGYAQKSGSAVYPPNTTAFEQTSDVFVQTEKSFVTPNYSVFCGLLRFDTASLPDDATITAATLRLWIDAMANANARSLVAEWMTDGAIAAADYVDDVGTNAHAGTTLASLTAFASNDLALTNLSNINRTGFTKIRIGVTGSTPTGENVMYIAALDHATLAEPQLIVDYNAYAPFDYSQFPKAKLRTVA